MKNIEDNFVPYEIALELKKLGFDEPCFGYYVGKDTKVFLLDETYVTSTHFKIDSKITFRAPLYQQAFGFFREKYNLSYLIAEYNKDGSLVISISKNRIEIFDKLTSFDINDYNEAELECLKQLILIANETNKNK